MQSMSQELGDRQSEDTVEGVLVTCQLSFHKKLAKDGQMILICRIRVPDVKTKMSLMMEVKGLEGHFKVDKVGRSVQRHSRWTLKLIILLSCVVGNNVNMI